MLPTSLVGQMVLLLGLALLVAQLANFALILNERQKLSLAQNEGPAIAAFTVAAAGYVQAAPEFRQAVLDDNRHRGARFAAAAVSGISDADRDARLEAQVTQSVVDADTKVRAIRATRAADPETSATHHLPSDAELLRIAAQAPDGSWLAARMVAPRRDPFLALRLGGATLLLYLFVLGATILIAVRIARPLRDLAGAAGRFAGHADPIPIAARGPDDVRRAVDAFNAMSARVSGLLDEKDHMLGAVGHDLRTPLASLRIRVEAMEPAEDRAAAIAKIEEMVAMLEDILTLARGGRVREARVVDLAALCDTVVEEYRELGQPVTYEPAARQVATVQPDLIRRALRNLIDNAVKYGGGAEVSVTPRAGALALTVADHGPGIAPDQHAQVLRPFYRTESSRNRDTGGAGLGLAIAGSIAASHGGGLELAANQPSGLRVAIIIPRIE